MKRSKSKIRLLDKKPNQFDSGPAIWLDVETTGEVKERRCGDQDRENG